MPLPTCPQRYCDPASLVEHVIILIDKSCFFPRLTPGVALRPPVIAVAAAVVVYVEGRLPAFDGPEPVVPHHDKGLSNHAAPELAVDAAFAAVDVAHLATEAGACKLSVSLIGHSKLYLETSPRSNYLAYICRTSYPRISEMTIPRGENPQNDHCWCRRYSLSDSSGKDLSS